MVKVLVIERQDSVRTLIEGRVNGDLSIESMPSVQVALTHHARDPFDLVLWDTNSESRETRNIVRTLKSFARNSGFTRMVVISNSDEPKSICARKLDYEWLCRPVDEREFLALVQTMICCKSGDQRGRSAGFKYDVPTEFEGILGLNLFMQPLIQQILEAAAVDVPVLITGETGTGKDLVAAAIHKRSKRSDAPYLPVNTGAVTSGLIASELFGHEKGAYTGASEARAGFFEQAQGGTLFLDEIATMDEKCQISLLRVLETQTIRRVGGDRDIKINVRVIAATNENIEETVKAGRFREDLYYRLDVFRIHLPPLRERPGGVSLLTDHFVSRFDDRYKKDIRVVSPETYRLLRRYPWPGNVRELKNVIQRAVLLAEGAEFTPELLPARIRESNGASTAEIKAQSSIQLGMSLAEVEKEFIKMTLLSVSGNKMKAASSLSISRRALYNKLKKFDLV